MIAARPTTPPTTPPAIAPVGTVLGLGIGRVVDVAELGSPAVAVAEVVELVETADVAVARDAKDTASNENVVEEGFAEDSDENVSFVRVSLTAAIGLS